MNLRFGARCRCIAGAQEDGFRDVDLVTTRGYRLPYLLRREASPAEAALEFGSDGGDQVGVLRIVRSCWWLMQLVGGVSICLCRWRPSAMSLLLSLIFRDAAGKVVEVGGQRNSSAGAAAWSAAVCLAPGLEHLKPVLLDEPVLLIFVVEVFVPFVVAELPVSHASVPCHCGAMCRSACCSDEHTPHTAAARQQLLLWLFSSVLVLVGATQFVSYGYPASNENIILRSPDKTPVVLVLLLQVMYTAPQAMSYRELLVGLGDSSFGQVPCPWAPSCLCAHGDCASSTNVPAQPKISQIACGATIALAVVAVEGNNASPSLQEWGTGLYGERLSPEILLPWGDERAVGTTADPTPANHPTRPFTIPPLGPGTSPAIRHIACGAHFVMASLQAGGCMSWGGGREATRVLGRGGCGSCSPCSRDRSRRIDGSTPVAAVDPPPFRSSAGSSKPRWLAEPLGLGGSQVSSLAAGDDHTIAICVDGSAWAWGRGDCGQLGCGSDTRSSCVPLAVQIPCGATTSRAPVTMKTSEGERHEALRSSEAAKVIAVACGRDHSAILTNDGRVWTFGSGLHGQLGLGTVGEMAWVPAAVESLEGVGTMRQDGSFTGVASVACGAWHTAVLSATGDVYAWGWRRHG